MHLEVRMLNQPDGEMTDQELLDSLGRSMDREVEWRSVTGRRRDTGDRRRNTDRPNSTNERDAEGTERSPEARRALEAGELNAPPADEPRGRWGS